MSNYLKFITQDGQAIYVEIEAQDIKQPVIEGEAMAALPGQKKIKELILNAQDTFDDAVAGTRRNADVFIANIRKMSDLPDEVEITFGLKADGELGCLAVAKVGIEANYTVKLTWKKAEKARDN
jgi:hypothetical protein